jgi:hypothetical protein
VIGSFSRSSGRRAGSASLASRSVCVPVVASHHAWMSSNKFQFSKVKVKPASVVSPCPTTRMPRSRQLFSHSSRRRWMCGRSSKAWTTFMIIGRPLTVAISS